jgi:hypothetical protein
MAHSSTAAQTSAKVIGVTVLSPATAVLQDGTWKVGAASFCGLLALQNGGSTKSLPAVCKPGS